MRIKKYPEPATKPKLDRNIFASHKHSNFNSNAIVNNENLFQQKRNTFEKIGAPDSNNVKQKTKNVVILTDSMLKLLRMKEFNKNLNGGIAHLKPFSGSRAKQMDNYAISLLREHQFFLIGNHSMQG